METGIEKTMDVRVNYYVCMKTNPRYFSIDCPIWNINLWNNAEQKDSQEMILKPVAMFENPFFHSPHKLVMCDVWVSMETPSGKFRVNVFEMYKFFFTINKYIYINYIFYIFNNKASRYFK